ncbi:MAG: hypothetical protein R2729_09320 [Bryobacteraceae bacterium]
MSGISMGVALGQGSPASTVPASDTVLYRAFFFSIKRLDDKARSQPAITGGAKMRLQLSDAQFTTLARIAQSHAAAKDRTDAQARTVIAAFREQIRKSRGIDAPPVPAEITRLQEESDNHVRVHMQRINAELGNAVAQKIQLFIDTEYKPRSRTTPLPPVPPPPGARPSDLGNSHK